MFSFVLHDELHSKYRKATSTNKFVLWPFGPGGAGLRGDTKCMFGYLASF